MSRVLPYNAKQWEIPMLLDGRKTVTRRIVPGKVLLCPKMQHKVCFLPNKRKKDRGRVITSIRYSTLDSFAKHEAPYQPGDILYVRETYRNQRVANGCEIQYRADFTIPEDACYGRRGGFSPAKWRPSIHMPKEAARIWLKVTDVRVERLQEIKPVDVIKEGAYEDCLECLDTYSQSGSQCCYGTEDECSQCDSVMMEWEKLWNSTLKKSDLDRYGWDANPWVWVIEFERCVEPERKG